MKHNYQPRLKIYHNILGKFDLIEKYNNLQSKIFKTISIKIFWHFNEWSKTDLNKLLFKEFYFQQRFKYKKMIKRIENIFFIITLRKNNVFLYLEILLNLYFLTINTGFDIKQKFISTITIPFTIPTQNKFFNYTNNFKIQFNNVNLKNCFKFASTLNSSKVLLQFNYYFLPFNNLGE